MVVVPVSLRFPLPTSPVQVVMLQTEMQQVQVSILVSVQVPVTITIPTDLQYALRLQVSGRRSFPCKRLTN